MKTLGLCQCFSLTYFPLRDCLRLHTSLSVIIANMRAKGKYYSVLNERCQLYFEKHYPASMKLVADYKANHAVLPCFSHCVFKREARPGFLCRFERTIKNLHTQKIRKGRISCKILKKHSCNQISWHSTRFWAGWCEADPPPPKRKRKRTEPSYVRISSGCFEFQIGRYTPLSHRYSAWFGKYSKVIKHVYRIFFICCMKKYTTNQFFHFPLPRKLSSDIRIRTRN